MAWQSFTVLHLELLVAVGLVSSENNVKAHVAMLCIVGPFGWVGGCEVRGGWGGPRAGAGRERRRAEVKA